MKRNNSWVWILAGGVGLLFLSVALMSGGGSSSGGQASVFGPHVALVTLQGPISDTSTRSLLGGSAGGVRGFISDLEEASDDPNARAIVIRINSPGGSASASQEMYQAVLRARKSKKVYASMGDVAASGGYYIAAGCDKIFANPSTLTGSIGVISQFLNYQGLFRKVGLDSQTFKSGQFKDSGSPTRPLTAPERALFQAMIRDIYTQFVDDIVAGRKSATGGKLTKAKLLPLADGRVFTGVQAKRAALIDSLGGLHEAVQEAGKAAGIKGKVVAREVEKPGLFGGLFGASAAAATEGVVAQAGEAFGRSLGAGLAEELTARLKSSSQAPQLESGLQN
jgi:protease-4